MPKRVDHHQRRTEIISALLRVVESAGLAAVTMRNVADEANVSLRLVQYYFETKSQLLTAALKHLEDMSNQRWDLFASNDGLSTGRQRLDALIDAALPTDPDSRLFHLAWTSYALMSLTDPDFAAETFTDGHRRLEHTITTELATAATQGQTPPHLDAAYEAKRLLALLHGVGTSLLIGHTTPAESAELLRHHLDDLFTA